MRGILFDLLLMTLFTIGCKSSLSVAFEDVNEQMEQYFKDRALRNASAYVNGKRGII